MIYGNTTDLIAYHTARGTTVADDDATEQALQRASDYIRTRYALRYDMDVTSERVIEATYIAAGYDIKKPGFWTATFTPSQQKVLTAVGDIKWSTVGGKGGADDALPTSPAIDALLMPPKYSGIGIMVV